jgi:hypothetical protein
MLRSVVLGGVALAFVVGCSSAGADPPAGGAAQSPGGASPAPIGEAGQSLGFIQFGGPSSLSLSMHGGIAPVLAGRRLREARVSVSSVRLKREDGAFVDVERQLN